MSTLFTKIVNREIPSYKVAEDDSHFAFLDINPNAKGHTLVIPKEPQDKIFDLTKQNYLNLMDFAYRVAKALEKTIPCKRIGMSVVGLEVPHTHIHLIPITKMEDMQFIKKVNLSSDELSNLAKDISANFQ